MAGKSKSYKLTFVQKPGYVHVLATGDNSLANLKGYLEELVRVCTAKGYRRVLMEERLVGPRIGMLDVFDLAAQVSDSARGFFEAFAYVDVNAEDDRNAKFAENVAVNRGLRGRAFRTVGEATDWLKG